MYIRTPGRQTKITDIAIADSGKLSGEQRQLIENLVAHIRSKTPRTLAIYRFGTWGTSDERADSDLDLAVLTEQAMTAEQCFGLAQELAAQAGRNVDLIDLREASTVMRAQIIELSTARPEYCALDLRESSGRFQTLHKNDLAGSRSTRNVKGFACAGDGPRLVTARTSRLLKNASFAEAAFASSAPSTARPCTTSAHGSARIFQSRK